MASDGLDIISTDCPPEKLELHVKLRRSIECYYCLTNYSFREIMNLNDDDDA